MKYGVKFCGGCNPRYDRIRALGTIKDYFGNKAEFVTANEAEKYDGLLVIGGCTNCCPNYEHFNTKKGPHLLKSEDHLTDIIKNINREVEEI